MKTSDILILLFQNAKGVTKDRVLKAQGLASRSKIDWALVLNAMTPEQRQQVDDAS